MGNYDDSDSTQPRPDIGAPPEEPLQEYPGEYRKPEPSVSEYERRRDAERAAETAEKRLAGIVAGDRPAPDPEELRSRAAVGSEMWREGKRYPFEGTDRDPERNGLAVYPDFVSEAQRFAWINAKPFVQSIDGRFVNVNEGLPAAVMFGYPEPGTAPGQAPEPAPFRGPIEAPIDWDNLPIVNREMVEKRKAADAQGQLLELFDTGGWARVKMLDVLDRASLGWVPNHLQDKLAEMLDLVEGAPKVGGKVVSTAEAWTRYQKMLGDAEQLADAFCIYGFIEPRLVATERELELAGEGALLVTDITKAERRSYLNKCIVFDDREARLLDPFRRKQVSATPNRPRN